MIQTMSNPTRITTIKITIFKTDISDHFPVCIIISSTEKLVQNKYTYLYKSVITDDANERFKERL